MGRGRAAGTLLQSLTALGGAAAWHAPARAAHASFACTSSSMQAGGAVLPWDPCWASLGGMLLSLQPLHRPRHLHQAPLDLRTSNLKQPHLPAQQQHEQQQPPQQHQQHSAAYAESPWNPPNVLSLARGASGLPIACLILQEQWPVACVAVVVSGATDWLDGYLARRMGLQSVLGSYLDPLGDKLLICSVVSALAVKGLIPVWVAAVVVGRDVGLVGGLMVHRWRTLGWRRVSAAEFFRTQAPASAPAPAAAPRDSSGTSASLGHGVGAPHTSAATPLGGGPEPPAADAGVPLMRPLLISKLNTVLQLSLVSGCLGHAWVAWPDAHSLHALEVATAATTAASCLAYAQRFLAGKLL